MGSFSWYASDTKRAIRSENCFTVYALVPDGAPLKETEYEGYGVFGGQDIYDLVADWNRKYLSEHPEFIVPQCGRMWNKEAGAWVPVPAKKVSDFEWYYLYADLSKTRKDIEQEMRGLRGRLWEYRYIGIDIACYDIQNAVLPYPIKLVENPVPYAAAAASKGDPCQGWGKNDRFEEA